MHILLFTIILAAFFTFTLNRKVNALRLSSKANGNKNLRFNSLPIHYVYCFVLWAIIFSITIISSSFGGVAKYFLITIFLVGNFYLVKFFYHKKFNAKNHVESLGVVILSATAAIGILITAIITISILFESIRFFEMVKISDFLFGLSWNPQMAINAEQAVGQSAFGVIPVFLGTLLITIIAMLVAVPVGIMAAVYLGLYAKSKTRDFLNIAKYNSFDELNKKKKRKMKINIQYVMGV